jgi:hypothetical protein
LDVLQNTFHLFDEYVYVVIKPIGAVHQNICSKRRKQKFLKGAPHCNLAFVTVRYIFGAFILAKRKIRKL